MEISTTIPPPAEAAQKFTTVKKGGRPRASGNGPKPKTLGVQTEILRSKKHLASPALVAKLAPEIEPELAKERKQLSDEQRTQLSDLKGVVRKGLDEANLAARALSEIEQLGLWEESHNSFADFCRDEFDMSAQRVTQLLKAAEEIAYLRGKVDDALIPNSERGIRALRRVKNTKKAEVLRVASELANGARPNSVTIEQARLQIEGATDEKEKPAVIKTEAALKAASVFQKFVSECDVMGLTGHEIAELRTAIGGIMLEAEKLGNKAA